VAFEQVSVAEVARAADVSEQAGLIGDTVAGL
jgi:hypothetical protein